MDTFSTIVMVLLLACAVIAFAFVFIARRAGRRGWTVIFAVLTLWELYLAWTVWKP